MTRIYIAVLIVLAVSACGEMSRDLNVKNIKGYDFSLKEIQESCSAKRIGDQDIAVNCDNGKLGAVSRGCIGRMSAGLKDPKFYCSGGLWVLNDWCYIEMTTPQKGNIRCKRK